MTCDNYESGRILGPIIYSLFNVLFIDYMPHCLIPFSKYSLHNFHYTKYIIKGLGLIIKSYTTKELFMLKKVINICYLN